MDPYAVLGVDPDASPDQIREAFRALVRDRHPDTAPPGAGLNPAVSEVIEAYRLLMDPAERTRYDQGRQPSPPPQAPAPRCPACGGTGIQHRFESCPACGGHGETTLLGSGRARQVICRTCSGRGRRRRSVTCRECGGTGRT